MKKKGREGRRKKKGRGREGKVYAWKAPNPSTIIRSERGGGGRELKGDPARSDPKGMKEASTGSGRQDKMRKAA